MIRVWRICQQRYAASSFSGLSSLNLPGRWHHRGHRVVYTSQSLSLATLETLAQPRTRDPLLTYVKLYAEIPTDIQIYEVE